MFPCSTVLNYTWTRAGYTFDYFVGVCVAPISSGLKHCHIVQRITEPNGDISFHCLGGDVDNQVTDTKGTHIQACMLVCLLFCVCLSVGALMHTVLVCACA